MVATKYVGSEKSSTNGGQAQSQRRHDESADSVILVVGDAIMRVIDKILLVSGLFVTIWSLVPTITKYASGKKKMEKSMDRKGSRHRQSKSDEEEEVLFDIGKKDLSKLARR